MDENGAGMAFVAYYVRGDQVLAVCSVGKDPIVSHASELLRLGKMPSGTALKKGLDLLKVELSNQPSSAPWYTNFLKLGSLFAVVIAFVALKW